MTNERPEGLPGTGVLGAVQWCSCSSRPSLWPTALAPGAPPRPPALVDAPAVPPAPRSRLPALPLRDPVRRRRSARSRATSSTYLEWCRDGGNPARTARTVAGKLPRHAAYCPDCTVEVPTLGKSPAAQRQLRAALRRADAPGRGARAEGEGGDRRAQRRRAPLRAGRAARAVGDPPAPLRAGARTATGCRSRAGPCSPATATAASTATGRPRTSTTWCPAPAAARTRGTTWWPRAGPATPARRTASSPRSTSACARPPREPQANLWVVATAGSIDPAWEPFLPA